jgi:flagellar biosynthesis/type III secretory pathway protein FliH
MMELPPDLALQLSYFITVLEEEQKMEYVSSIERIKLEQQRHEGFDLGKQEGEQKGKQEGKQEGESAMLCRLLSRRFGDLPDWVQEQVKNAPKEQIEAWFDRGVDALTLDDVFQDLAH